MSRIRTGDLTTGQISYLDPGIGRVEPKEETKPDFDSDADDMLEFFEAWVKECGGYNSDFCDPTMCRECYACERNIFIEYYKRNNTCPQCFGLEIFSRTVSPRRSTTRLCNLCGGTGRFSPIPV